MLPTSAAEALAEGHVLADLIREVPRIIDFLDPDSRKALKTCNRQCQTLVRSHTTVITVGSPSDVKSINGKDWPKLALVIIPESDVRALDKTDLTDGKLSILAALNLWKRHWSEYYVVLLIKIIQEHQYHPAFRRDVSAACARPLHAKEWQTVRLLHLRHIELGAEDFAQLLAVPWLAIDLLVISDPGLTASSAKSLAQCNWPRLQQLELDWSFMDTASMRQLVQGRWPLNSLRLHGTPQSAPAALLDLCFAAWPKTSLLRTYDLCLESGSMSKLAQSPVSKVAILSMNSSSLNAENFQVLGHFGVICASWAWRITIWEQEALQYWCQLYVLS